MRVCSYIELLFTKNYRYKMKCRKHSDCLKHYEPWCVCKCDNIKTLCTDVIYTDPKKTVHFAEKLETTHLMVSWLYAYRVARQGPWMRIARDSLRFKKRISQLESVISPILTTSHREKIIARKNAYDYIVARGLEFIEDKPHTYNSVTKLVRYDIYLNDIATKEICKDPSLAIKIFEEVKKLYESQLVIEILKIQIE